MAEASASAAVDAALANAQPLAASRGIDLLMIRERQRLDVQAMHEKLLALLQELPADVKHKNANQFFKVVSSKEKSQQVRVECMACGHSMASNGSSRLVKHIVMCALMPKEIKKTFLKLKLTAQTESRSVHNLCSIGAAKVSLLATGFLRRRRICLPMSGGSSMAHLCPSFRWSRA